MAPANFFGGDISLKNTDTTSEKTDKTWMKDHTNKTKPTLHPDILAKIFEHLVPERPTASTHRKPPYEKSTNSANYRDLINVSRASRQFHVLAMPLLLNNVALPGPEHMLRLRRTLWRNPEERKHIRHLSFEYPVNKETKLSLTTMQLEQVRKDVRALPDGQAVRDAILSILRVEDGQSRHGGGSVHLWTAYFVHVLSMCHRLESLEIRLFTPWSIRNRNGVVGNRILWDFLLRVGRLPIGDTRSDSSQLVGDGPSSSWPPPYLRKVTVNFYEPQLPYDKVKDNRIEIDVVPSIDRLAHTRIMGEVEEWAGSSSIFQNYSTHNVPDTRMLLKRLLEEPNLIPHLSADEYPVFMFYLDRLKDIYFIKDMNFEEHIDSLQRLLHVPVNAKEGGDIGDLDLAKHAEFLRAYDLLVGFPHTSEHLTVSAMHGHLQLFEFLDTLALSSLDEYNRFEQQVDPLKMRSLRLIHTRKQSEEVERHIGENMTGQVVRRWFHAVDVVLNDYSELRALHLPLFLSYTLSEQAYINWSGQLILTFEGESFYDEEWTSLSELKALKELTMTFSGMTGYDEAGVDVDFLVKFFRDCLPPSLETLNLLEWWSWYYDFYTMFPADQHESNMILAVRRNTMLEFLENLSEAIVKERPASLKSLKKIQISYLEEGPGMFFSDLFVTLKERCGMCKIVDGFLGIELVVKPYKCGLEHFVPCPWW